MNRLALVAAVFLCGLAGQVASPAELREVRIAYVDRQDDPLYGENKGYAGIHAMEHRSPLPAAELAIEDAKMVGGAIGAKFVLIRRTIRAEEDPVTVLRTLRAERGIVAAIIDLPGGDTARVALGVASEPVALFNARHTDVQLREVTCQANLFHTIPSLDMLTDGLAQGLRLRNWTKILLLEGEKPEDAALSMAFQESAKKFGLDVVEVRRFVLGNDPRRRDQSNVRLLTGGVRYDVVFVADRARQFAPFVPYNTLDPRPVVGSEGLVAVAWHVFWERHGAPQLNRRFARRSGRLMTEEDWATWVAVRAVAEAAVRNRNSPGRPINEALLDSNLTLELYKGFPGSFRPWSRQLRQPVLLATTNAVVGLAPVEGMLHEGNTLDSLGSDAPQFNCRS